MTINSELERLDTNMSRAIAEITRLRIINVELHAAAGAAEDVLQAFNDHVIVQRCLAILRTAITNAEKLP